MRRSSPMIGRRVIARRGERTGDRGVVEGSDGPHAVFVRWNSDHATTSYLLADLAGERGSEATSGPALEAAMEQPEPRPVSNARK
jgi:hypothetical protein